MESKQVIEVVEKLVGPVDPIGDSWADEKRLKNLNCLMDVAFNLIDKIKDVSREKNSQLHSVMVAGKKADKFLMEIVENFELSESDGPSMVSDLAGKMSND